MTTRNTATPRLFALILALLPLAACATSPRLSDDCAANAMCRARAAEPALLAASHGMADRQGDILALHPSDAPAIGFADHKDACDAGDAARCEGYALMGTFPKARAVISRAFFIFPSDVASAGVEPFIQITTCRVSSTERSGALSR